MGCYYRQDVLGQPREIETSASGSNVAIIHASTRLSYVHPTIIFRENVENSSWHISEEFEADNQAIGRQLDLLEMPKAIHFGCVSVEGRTYVVDDWNNTPATILSAIPKRLHLKENHPLRITRELIESCFPGYKYYNSLFPIVSTFQNFDSLGFPTDHPGRNKSDTYYINKQTVLRTHTSAHQADLFKANESDGFLISADVYRRDAIDRSHYPVFHQMEGAMTWDRKFTSGGDYVKKIWEATNAIPKHQINVEDPNPTVHPERNPLQHQYHSLEECEAMAAHLKRSLENVVVQIFSQAQHATAASTDKVLTEEPLRVRWVEAYFPFTSPSWELEVWWQGDWLEVLGCGIVKQNILNNADQHSRSGWAFGLGLERIAMLLFSIPDIRLFWSDDVRFLSQFSSTGPLNRFVPFSKHPACYKDVAFWLPTTSSAAGGQTAAALHENDVMELVRETAGNLVEDVRLTDEFTHPKTGRKSMCYRINYRSLERTLTNSEANDLHDSIRRKLVAQFGVELR
ncbi:phenylalanine-tRNA ligase [Verruconis gallopava]|uniref:Phenylalanine--tRNA ligase, mitochondrial n=1 Tax=Verruconis gallopava TaxID=253628 RepID=A0A0D1Z018_9PEZI|nr:phenylalanine-tRNA ligase [Verruconis gallopava]KIW06302.1 phenylalanine-tRNA ligase [Verruconis gallopava]